VLDDAHQHPGLAKDLSLVVVDGHAAFGNGRIVPAGPLRETVADGMARADALVIMGEDVRGLEGRFAGRLPVLKARFVPGPELARLRGQRVVAFAGIGEPRKFFATLRELGAQVVATHPFDDHFAFGEADIQPILDEAYAVGALPVTTAKDAVRLPPDQRQQVNVLSVEVAWDDPPALDALLDRIKR
jgi:tetraacyldisaccharide 4'-kinase